MRHGERVSEEISENDAKALIAISEDFFNHDMKFRSGIKARVYECELYRNFMGEPIINSARRIICPENTKFDVKKLLKQKVHLFAVVVEE